MNTVLLAGGLGTRLAEETGLCPKPMVEIGGRPSLWHIMSTCATYEFHDFVVTAGYISEVIKEYFANFVLQSADIRGDLATGKVEMLNRRVPDGSMAIHSLERGVSKLLASHGMDELACEKDSPTP